MENEKITRWLDDVTVWVEVAEQVQEYSDNVGVNLRIINDIPVHGDIEILARAVGKQLNASHFRTIGGGEFNYQVSFEHGGKVFYKIVEKDALDELVKAGDIPFDWCL